MDLRNENLGNGKITPVELIKLENSKYINHSNTMTSIYPKKTDKSL